VVEFQAHQKTSLDTSLSYWFLGGFHRCCKQETSLPLDGDDCSSFPLSFL
jgi:hypothetical protein